MYRLVALDRYLLALDLYGEDKRWAPNGLCETVSMGPRGVGGGLGRSFV